MLYFKIARSWFASASTAPAVKIMYEVSDTSMSVMIILQWLMEKLQL